MTRQHALIASLLAAALGCGRPAADRTLADTLAVYDDPIDPVSGYETSCMFDTTHAHPDGRALLAEFLERDARGEFLQSDPWFRGATDCPGHEPGWDTHAVITSYELAAQRVKDSLWLGIVTSHEVGWVSYGGPPKYEPFLSIDVRDAIDTLRAIRTRFGWRIEGPQRAQRVLLSDPRSARVREEYSDSLARLGIH